MINCAQCDRSLPDSSFRIYKRKTGDYQDPRCRECGERSSKIFGKTGGQLRVNCKEALKRWRLALDSKRSSVDLWESLADIPDLVSALYEREDLLQKYTVVFNTFLTDQQKSEIAMLEISHNQLWLQD